MRRFGLSPLRWFRRSSLLWEGSTVATFGLAVLLLAAQPEVALQHWYVLTIPMILAASRHGRNGAVVMSVLSTVVLVGAYQQQDETEAFQRMVDFMGEIAAASTSPAEAQRLALQLANLRASDPTTTFQRSLLGLASVIITSLLLGSKVDRLEAMSTTDGLTGLANRRHFDLMLEQEWRRALRARGPLSLLLVDVDQFKVFNDSLGHSRGDACLQAVAQALKMGARRAGDVAARFGGEEFVLLLPHTDARGAGAVGNMIRDGVASLQIPHPVSHVSPFVTISVGAACLVPSPGRIPRDLIVAADEALYRAKAAGRNRVVMADSPGIMIAAREAQLVEEQRT